MARKYSWFAGKSTGHGYAWYEMELQPDFATIQDAAAWLDTKRGSRLDGFDKDFHPDAYMLVPSPMVFSSTGMPISL